MRRVPAHLKRAAIGHRRVKDLLSVQLGRADLGVTVCHYARWAGGDGYRDPMRLEPGEVPADLLARLVAPLSSPPSESLEGASDWWSLRESNPCLQDEKPLSNSDGEHAKPGKSRKSGA